MSKISFLLFSILLLSKDIFADGAAAAAPQAGSAFGGLVPLLIIFVFNKTATKAKKRTRKTNKLYKKR